MYQAQRLSRSEFVPVRTLNYHVRVWGQPTPGQAPLVLLHGWMDVAASFQFVVDAMAQEHFIIAPDWRGFGLTAGGGVDCFWHPDYLADLETLLDHYAGAIPVDLVGHSMGGNVAMLYAGVRPERVRRLVNLEGFGLPATRPEQAPARYAQWLDEIKQWHQGGLGLKSYDSLDAVAQRLMKTNPRLPGDKARWLACHWSAETAPGQWTILGEAAHKVVSAHLYREDEMLAVYRGISAPALMVEAVDDSIATFWKGRFTRAQHHERLKAVADVRICQLPECGHMLHHDQPRRLAELIDGFLSTH
ncbi:alpha/beta hydrolase [Rhodoferax sp.]|uniref:alpha/beta fold hydrolase n=1 Tax=Rhodoferax sp. TaxID=50421 RepID=UPI0026123A45|nr:alpha/beta hydrolase [Rhodoferax sp.]MDD2926325.1 alpha/beta hydrolase [Rhodoferax sp.]